MGITDASEVSSEKASSLPHYSSLTCRLLQNLDSGNTELLGRHSRVFPHLAVCALGHLEVEVNHLLLSLHV